MAAQESKFSPEQREVIEAYPLLKAVVDPEVDFGSSSENTWRWVESIVINIHPLRESLVRKMGYAPYAVFLHGFVSDKTYEGLFSEEIEALPDNTQTTMNAFLVETILLIGYQINDAVKLARVAIPIFTELSRIGYLRQSAHALQSLSGLLNAGRSLTLLDYFEQSGRQKVKEDSQLAVFRNFINHELQNNPPISE